RLPAVEDAFLDDRDFEVVGERVEDARAHAAAGRAAGDEHGVGFHLVQHAHQRRAEKSAWLLLPHEHVARLRRDLGDDLVALLPLTAEGLAAAAVLAVPAAVRNRAAALVAGRVERRQALFPRRREQVADAIDAFPALLTAAVAEALDRFEDRLRLVA